MTNAPFESKAELRDVESINFVEEAIADGDAESYEDVRDAVERVGRDNARTPMQWSDDDNAGFTEGEPWLKVNPNHDTVNVEHARADPDSVWHHYRELGELREERDLLVYGEFELLAPEDEQVFAYTRLREDELGVVALNVSEEPATVAVPEWIDHTELELAIANLDAPETPDRTLELAPYEARVYLTPPTETDS